jgi:hypothetical protein
VVNAIPFCRVLGRAPTQISDRRCGKRDAAINRQPTFKCALHQAKLNFDRIGLLREA